MNKLYAVILVFEMPWRVIVLPLIIIYTILLFHASDASPEADIAV